MVVFIYTNPNEYANYTFSLEPALTGSFEISIKMISIHQGSVVIGFSDKSIENNNQSYVGGCDIKGQFGFASNGVIGRDGGWFWPENSNLLLYNNGDTITFKVIDGEITCLVNDVGKSDYVYKMEADELYLTFSFYEKNDSVEIIS